MQVTSRSLQRRLDESWIRFVGLLGWKGQEVGDLNIEHTCLRISLLESLRRAV